MAGIFLMGSCSPGLQMRESTQVCGEGFGGGGGGGWGGVVSPVLTVLTCCDSACPSLLSRLCFRLLSGYTGYLARPQAQCPSSKTWTSFCLPHLINGTPCLINLCVLLFLK